jgi:hypothetical protein
MIARWPVQPHLAPPYLCACMQDGSEKSGPKAPLIISEIDRLTPMNLFRAAGHGATSLEPVEELQNGFLAYRALIRWHQDPHATHAWRASEAREDGRRGWRRTRAAWRRVSTARSLSLCSVSRSCLRPSGVPRVAAGSIGLAIMPCVIAFNSLAVMARAAGRPAPAPSGHPPTAGTSRWPCSPAPAGVLDPRTFFQRRGLHHQLRAGRGTRMPWQLLWRSLVTTNGW